MSAVAPYRSAQPSPSSEEEEVPDFRDLRPMAYRHGWRFVLGTGIEVFRVGVRVLCPLYLGFTRYPAFLAILPCSILFVIAYTKLRPVLARRHARAVEREAEAWLARMG